jgi:hypothetical protein
MYFINHSFKPNSQWHLGFVFAHEDIPAGAELTLIYRVLMNNDPEFGFIDEITGERVCGFPWKEQMIFNSNQLLLPFKDLANGFEQFRRTQQLIQIYPIKCLKIETII